MDGDLSVVGMLVLLISSVGGLMTVQRQQGRLLRRYRTGCALLEQGHAEQAESYFRETLEIATRRFGANHWRTAFHLHSLGLSLIGQQKLDDAAPLVERALKIVDGFRTQLPHPDLVLVILGGAIFAHARGDAARFDELLEIARREGADSPAMINKIERTLVDIENARGRWAEAADAASRMTFWAMRPGDAGLVARVGAERLRANDAERAARCLTLVARAAERQAPRAFSTAYFRGLLGQALARTGRDREAVAELDRALAGYDRAAGARHPAAAALLVELAEVRLRLGDLERARAACERVLALGAVPPERGAAPYRSVSASGHPMAKEMDRARAILERTRVG